MNNRYLKRKANELYELEHGEETLVSGMRVVRNYAMYIVHLDDGNYVMLPDINSVLEFVDDYRG